jgi:hypothetical protein
LIADPLNWRKADKGGTDVLRGFWLSRRKAGLSRQAFIDHYETQHRFLGEKVIKGYATSYVRNILYAATPGGPEPVYDAITEISFPDRAAYDTCMASFAKDPEMVKIIVEDEARFIDRESTVHYLSETFVSKL